MTNKYDRDVNLIDEKIYIDKNERDQVKSIEKTEVDAMSYLAHGHRNKGERFTREEYGPKSSDFIQNSDVYSKSKKRKIHFCLKSK